MEACVNLKVHSYTPKNGVQVRWGTCRVCCKFGESHAVRVANSGRHMAGIRLARSHA